MKKTAMKWTACAPSKGSVQPALSRSLTWHRLRLPLYGTQSFITHIVKTLIRPPYQTCEKTQISLGIHPIWSESLLSVLWVAKDPKLLQADIEDLSDTVDSQADLCLRWAHTILLVLSSSHVNHKLSQLMRLWYLSHRQPAKAQASLRIHRAFAVCTHEVRK